MRALATSIGALWIAGWCVGCGQVDPGFKGMITIDQSNSTTPTTGVACTTNDTNKYVSETSYFRVYNLADHDISGKFRVTTATFEVSQREIGAGFTRFPITVSIHDYNGPVGGDTIDTTQLSLVKSTTVDIRPEATNSFLVVKYDLPIDAEITADAFAFKIHIESFVTQKHKFFLAVSEMGDKEPAYMACGANAPKTLTGFGAPQHSLRMQITGESY